MISSWTPEWIRASCGGTWVSRPPEGVRLEIEGVSTDTRTLRPGQAFVALRGERFDGHAFVAQAAEAGAPMVVVDEAGAASARSLRRPVAVLRVADTRRALGRMAAAHRRSLERTRVVGVGGSNGKTTTVRLIHAVLSSRLRGTASARSFNNEIGVPLTLLGAKPTDQYVVCEIGSNAPGEIAHLGTIAQPDVAVITSIGREHLAFLTDLAGVAREEAALAMAVRPGGLLIAPRGAPFLDEHLRAAPSLLTFGAGEGADLRLTGFEQRAGPTGLSIRIGVNHRAWFEAPLAGRHNALNALAAIAVGRRFGLGDEEIQAGLHRATPPEMRLERYAVRGVDVVNDAYNANPDSVLAALETFPAITPGAARRVVVLGDMLELGGAGPDAHREIADAIVAGQGIDVVITVGNLAGLAAERLLAHWPESRVVRVPDLNAGQARLIAGALREGDAVLLKGSRAMRLERIVAELRDAGPAPSPGVETRRADAPARAGGG